MQDLKDRFILNYGPLVSEFLQKIAGVNYDKIPQPFLPVCGELYAAAEARIMFVGIETRGWGNITEFASLPDRDIATLFDDHFEEFNELEFCGWGNNFGNSFWDFNLKFLSAFHNIDDWRELKQRKNEDILKSFAWGNANSVERYHVTAEKKGVQYKDWRAVKEASKLFDKGGYLLQTFRPHVMVILNWQESEEWLQDQTTDILERQEIGNHFWYYYLPKAQTHVLWLPHPMWLSKNRDFDDYIEYLVNFIKQRL